jgi:hypothetical protein
LQINNVAGERARNRGFYAELPMRDFTGTSHMDTASALTFQPRQTTLWTLDGCGPNQFRGCPYFNPQGDSMRTRFIGVFAGCSLLGLAHVASAATAEAAGDPAASSAPAVLEEVIVSARRREESLQDVPLVVQAWPSSASATSGMSLRSFRA